MMIDWNIGARSGQLDELDQIAGQDIAFLPDVGWRQGKPDLDARVRGVGSAAARQRHGTDDQRHKEGQDQPDSRHWAMLQAQPVDC